MTDQAPSNRRGVAALLARGLWFGALLLVGCAGSGTGGSSTGGSGGSVSATGGSGTGGATGSGGVGTGGSATGGQLGSGGSGTGGTTGGSGGGSGAKGTGGAAGSSGKGGSVGSGGSSGGSSGAGGHGSGGASQGGIGGSSAASHCGARPGMVFCDGFEADAPGAPPAPWSTSINGSSSAVVTIDATDPAAGGTKSVHIQDGPNAADYQTLLALHDASVLPVAGGRLYVRFYIRLAAPMTADHNAFVLGDLFASQGNGNNLIFGEQNQMLGESINNDGQGATSKIGSIPAAVWTCVELLLDHNGPEVDVWVNGTEISDLHSTAWKVDAYDYLRFGFVKFGGPSSEIWYDDIAFGTQPIGCN